MQEECYRLRSSHEELRRNCWVIFQDTFDRTSTTIPSARSFREELDAIKQQQHVHLNNNHHDTSLQAAVQLLSEYCVVWEDHSQQLQSQINQQQTQIKKLRDSNQSQVKELQSFFKENESAWMNERQELHEELQSMKRQLDESQTTIVFTKNGILHTSIKV
jgi:ribosomal protein S20